MAASIRARQYLRCLEAVSQSLFFPHCLKTNYRIGQHNMEDDGSGRASSEYREVIDATIERRSQLDIDDGATER